MRTKHISILILNILLATITAFAAEPVGTIVSLTGKATATAQDNTSRILELKSPVMLNDRIKTEAGSSIQIMFLDDSLLSQGEKSEMTVDEYVYNPLKKEENKCTLNLSKGLFRAVTARITALNPERFKIKTKLATIGIRGCEVGFSISERGENVYILSLPDGKSIIITLNAGVDASAFTTSGTATKEQAIEIIRAGIVVQIEEGGGASQRQVSPQEAIEFIESLTTPGEPDNNTPEPTPGEQGGDNTQSLTDQLANNPTDSANQQSNEETLLETKEEAVATIESQQTTTTTTTTTPTTTIPPPALQYTTMGSGIGWEWGVWGYPGSQPEKVDFKAAQILPDSAVAALFSPTPGYFLNTSGTAAAIVNHSGNNYLVNGPCDITVSIGTAAPGIWTVVTPSPITDGANTSLTLDINGQIDANGIFTGTLSPANNQLTVNGAGLGNADTTGSGATAHLFGAGTPSGIIGNFNATFGSGAATVHGGFAAPAAPF